MMRELKNCHEFVYWQKDKHGRCHKYRRTLFQLECQAGYCWDAAKLNPSWGNQRITATKLFMVGYVESRLEENAMNILNKDHSIDVGMLQVNSCHWFCGPGAKDWQTFCQLERYDPSDITLLFDGQINVQFAAWLNEGFFKKHQPKYKYYKNKREKMMYLRLLKSTNGKLRRL